MKDTNTISWKPIIAQSIKLFRAHFEEFVQPITLNMLLGAVLLIIDFFDFPYHATITGIMALISIPISLWLMIVMLRISRSIIQERKTFLPQIYQDSTRRLVPFFMTGLMILLLIIALTVVVYAIWAAILFSTLSMAVKGDPEQYLLALQHTLTSNPEQILGLLTPGIIVLIVLGVISLVVIIFAGIKYFFAAIDSALADNGATVMEYMARCSRVTKKRWKAYLPAIIIPFILITVFESIVATGIGSIITAGRYDLLELSGNIYYNVLSLVITELFAPIMYLVFVHVYLALYAPNETHNQQ